MKAIEKLKSLICDEFNPEVQIITFKHGATGFKIKRKGYSIRALNSSKSFRMEFLTIEPKQFSNGDKWLFYGPLCTIIYGYSSVHYAKNIHQIIRELSKKEK